VSSAPVALTLAVRALRSLTVVDRDGEREGPAPGRPRTGDGIDGRTGRGVRRRLGAALTRLAQRREDRRRADPVLALAPDLPGEEDAVQRVGQLWRVLDLEAELALAAWSRARGADRRRARRAYRDALAREAWAAALLAQRAEAAVRAAS
jgi:hypothetical protein